MVEEVAGRSCGISVSKTDFVVVPSGSQRGENLTLPICKLSTTDLIPWRSNGPAMIAVWPV